GQQHNFTSGPGFIISSGCTSFLVAATGLRTCCPAKPPAEQPGRPVEHCSREPSIGSLTSPGNTVHYGSLPLRKVSIGWIANDCAGTSATLGLKLGTMSPGAVAKKKPRV